MARLEGAYEQINERLSDLRGDVLSLRGLITGLGETLRPEISAGDAALRSEISGLGESLRAEMNALGGTIRSEITAGDMAHRSEIAEMRRQMSGQFYWTLTLILGSILIPFLRELAR